MLKQLRSALFIFGLLTVILGVIYPLIVTGMAQAFFPHQANGSMIEVGGRYFGSELIGQQFDDPAYFWGRPSATSPEPYNAAASSGSNLGPSNPALIEAVHRRVEALHTLDPGNTTPIPVDLVTVSASGLDPHISVAAALYQLPRVARLRKVDESILLALIKKYTEKRQFGFLGEPRVNILLLNLALDGLK